MNTRTTRIPARVFARFSIIGLIGFLCLSTDPRFSCVAQEATNQPSVSTSIGSDGTGRIVIEAHGELPKPQVFYTARAQATVEVGPKRIEQIIQLTIKVIQGEAKTLSFGLTGEGEVTAVQGANIQSWSIRREGSNRFLDLSLKRPSPKEPNRIKNGVLLKPVIKIRSSKLKLPAVIDLTHLTPAESVGFDSIVNINYAAEVDATVTVADGFAPLDSAEKKNRFQTNSGGQLKLSLNRSGAAPAPVELTGTSLQGELHPNGESISFELRGTAHVTQANAEITILSGNAADSQMPTNANYRLRLTSSQGRPL